MITDLMDEYLNTLEDNGEDIEYYLSYKELVEMVFNKFREFLNERPAPIVHRHKQRASKLDVYDDDGSR